MSHPIRHPLCDTMVMNSHSQSSPLFMPKRLGILSFVLFAIFFI